MRAFFRLRANELDEAFLETVKSQFGEREIEVSVCEATGAQEDETAYLLRSPANRERLLEALRNIEQDRNLVTLEAPRYTLEELLESVAAEDLHGEVDTGSPVGREVW